MSKLNFTLRGGQADRFEQIKEQVEEETGHEVTRPRVISEMMQEWRDDTRR